MEFWAPLPKILIQQVKDGKALKSIVIKILQLILRKAGNPRITV